MCKMHTSMCNLHIYLEIRLSSKVIANHVPGPDDSNCQCRPAGRTAYCHDPVPHYRIAALPHYRITEQPSLSLNASPTVMRRLPWRHKFPARCATRRSPAKLQQPPLLHLIAMQFNLPAIRITALRRTPAPA